MRGREHDLVRTSGDDRDVLDYPEVLAEEVPRDEFTDREVILDELFDWAVGAAEQRANSIAFISPRRYGKTAVLQRLYNKLFWEQDRVAPFYIKISRQKFTLAQFADYYAASFFSQFSAFFRKEPTLTDGFYSLEMLRDQALENGYEDAVPIWDRYLQLSSADGKWMTQWLLAQELPAKISRATGTSTVVIIDEFQDLDDRIYWREGDELVPKGDLTGGFHAVCSQPAAPMLVAGSLVTIIARKVFGGPLGGRFGHWELDLMDTDASIELIYKLSEKYRRPVTDETALLVAEMAGGNPFYVKSALTSRSPDPDLTTVEGVEDVFTFEVTDPRGHIRDFWDMHFNSNATVLNNDPRERWGLTKRIILYILRREEERVSFKNIAKEFDLSEPEAQERLDDLLKADIVREVAWGLVTDLKDPLMKRCILARYRPLIEDVDESVVKAEIAEETREEIAALKKRLSELRGYVNTLIGREAELMLERAMRRFDGREVDGEEYFGIDRTVALPRFGSRPHSRRISLPDGREYQLDIVGIGPEAVTDQRQLWVVESKNWSDRPVGADEVGAFFETLAGAAEYFEIEPARITGWLYSRSGFTPDARSHLVEREILHTDYDAFAALFVALSPYILNERG